MAQRTVARLSDKKELPRMNKGQAYAFLEKIDPMQFKSRRARNIIRRALYKTKTREFVDALDTTIATICKICDLDAQLNAINPKLLKSQRDGTITRELNASVAQLISQWEKLIALV